MKNKTRVLLIAFLVAVSSAFAQQITTQAPETKGNEAQLSFGDIPELEKAYISTSPNKRNDGIPVGRLGVDGGDKALILKLAKAIVDGKHGNFDSFLIAHNGKLVFESYYSRGRVNLPHPQASATKSYTSLALGRAIQLGYLSMEDLHKPVISFLKDLDPSKLVAGADKITLHKALTMRSGIQLSEEQHEELEKSPRMLKGQGQVQAFLEHSEPITEATQVFDYKGDPILVMQVIEAVVPGSARDFIKNELLNKMGIINYSWETDVSGLPKSGNGTRMLPRDMIKWGTLALNKGKWNGEQLVPEAFIATSTSKIVDQSEEYDDTTRGVSGTAYGYFWWQADFSIGDKSYLAKSARGGSGQNIYVIEELDLVVVTTTHRPVDSSVAVTAENVIPAFIENAISTKDRINDAPDEFPPLEDRYLGQKPPGETPELFAPGIVSTQDQLETEVLFLPDMTALSFNRGDGENGDPTLIMMEYKDHDWARKPIALSDMDNYREQFSPSFTALNGLEPFKDIPIRGGALSAKGTYYFYVLDLSDGTGYMSYSRLINGQYEPPQKMSSAINRGKYIAHPFIAPDESYLMWDAEKEGEDRPDVYISFRKQDGSWGEAINMGDKINTPVFEQRPKVTPDGKYITFWRGYFETREDGKRYLLGNPYWVDAKIIETLKSEQ
ncbi:serine hydrolase [Roseivirga sp. E12]|uniref:serine hydrolase domain-containing protein n=1 Tax=Roseivirga sp. E12 TaxID=2819237 RepID=UPI001ABC6418|nr:serine hydrolase [Roseivirga sp. E12]MBO3697254.1 serine hydrolase [Roseivirga sp. E12]